MRVLIVEDEYKLAQNLRKALEADQYTVDVVYDGLEAYEQATVEEYDLILLDLNLPGMSGLQVCQKLRQDKIRVPILMLTAKDTLNDKVAGLDQGADDYLVKPFELDELLARVRALLRREGEAKQTILTVGSIVLDSKTQTVTRKGQLVDLSAKEYALLRFFMNRPQQIIDRGTLLDHIWGNEIDTFSNVIDVYIGYLRKKLNKAFPQEPAVIQTLKGMGYRFTPGGQ